MSKLIQNKENKFNNSLLQKKIKRNNNAEDEINKLNSQEPDINKNNQKISKKVNLYHKEHHLKYIRIKYIIIHIFIKI